MLLEAEEDQVFVRGQLILEKGNAVGLDAEAGVDSFQILDRLAKGLVGRLPVVLLLVNTAHAVMATMRQPGSVEALNRGESGPVTGFSLRPIAQCLISIAGYG